MICVRSVPVSSHIPNWPLCWAFPPISFTLKHWVTSKSQWSSKLQSLSLSSRLIQQPLSICRRLAPRMPVDTKIQGCSSQPSRLRISIYWGPAIFFRAVIKLKLFSLESSFLPQFYSKLLFQQCLYCGTYLPSQRQYDDPKSQNDSVMNPRSCANALIWFSYSHPWNSYDSIYLQRLLRSYMYQWRLCLTTSNKSWLTTKEVICFK